MGRPHRTPPGTVARAKCDRGRVGCKGGWGVKAGGAKRVGETAVITDLDLTIPTVFPTRPSPPLMNGAISKAPVPGTGSGNMAEGEAWDRFRAMMAQAGLTCTPTKFLPLGKNPRHSTWLTPLLGAPNVLSRRPGAPDGSGPVYGPHASLCRRLRRPTHPKEGRLKSTLSRPDCFTVH